MIEGLELTLKSFLDAVRKFGIEVVEEKMWLSTLMFTKR